VEWPIVWTRSVTARTAFARRCARGTRPGMTETERPDPDAPNESAPGHDIPEPPPDPEPAERPDPDAPNESAPGHAPS